MRGSRWRLGWTTAILLVFSTTSAGAEPRAPLTVTVVRAPTECDDHKGLGLCVIPEQLGSIQWDRLGSWFPFYLMPSRTAERLAENSIKLHECAQTAEEIGEMELMAHEEELADTVVEAATLAEDNRALAKALAEERSSWRIALAVVGSVVGAGLLAGLIGADPLQVLPWGK